MTLSKTDFLIARECNKNVWLKVHRPEVYKANPLSGFELNIIETGNVIDELARDLFPGGVLVEDRNDTEYSNELIAKRTPVVYQPVFNTGEYLAVADIIVWNEKTGVYDLCEVKSSTASREGDGEGGRKEKEYLIDLAFQKIVMDAMSIPVGTLNLIRINKGYVRSGDLSVSELFVKLDLTEEAEALIPDINRQMAGVREYLLRESEPVGHCDCWSKSKNNHCTTFAYSNPEMPEYSVHQISRIGNSKKKLEALIDGEIIDIHDVPKDFKLSDNQRRQVDVAQSGRTYIDEAGVEEFLKRLEYPLSFIDYESYPSAIPRFSGYKPYQQIPFQFSLHVIDSPGAEVVHSDFIHTEDTNPDEAFLAAMQVQLPASGSVLVWNKTFEMMVNKQLAERVPQYQEFITGVQDRVIDLIEPFGGKTAVYVHPGFLGRTTIKLVLPTLVPELSYKDLEIQEGGTASDTWNRIALGQYDEEEKSNKTKALLEYCRLDTLAMVRIWETLNNLIK